MTASEPRVLPVGLMSSPCLCIDVEMSAGCPSIPPQAGPQAAQCAWLLVAAHTEAIGCVIVEVPPKGLTADQVAAAIATSLGPDLATRGETTESPELQLPQFLASRREVLRAAPMMTVVVCTRERPEGLDACLRSLLQQEYPNFSILVIDNAPVTDRTESTVKGFASPLIQYVAEPRKGLSWARNKALEMVSDEIIAWIDDDETADPHWLAELARGFHDYPDADAVAGVMVPGELETRAQVWFEQYGGHNKQRGFTRAVFSPDTAFIQSPLYPLPPFGTGGNMAFRMSALEKINGFDLALGAGSRSMGAEDTRAFTDLLCAGGTVVYQPTAVTRHFHRRSVKELRQQMLGYGVGLTAFYTSLVISRPRCVPQLIRLLPLARRDLLGNESLQSGDLPPDFPPEFLRTKRRGMLIGPLAYLRARWDAARQRTDRA
jgi:glycosyltransferase involved in cell wall biosynthesis